MINPETLVPKLISVEIGKKKGPSLCPRFLLAGSWAVCMSSCPLTQVLFENQILVITLVGDQSTPCTLRPDA